MLPRRPFRRSPPPPLLRPLRPPLPGMDPRAREGLMLAHQAMERGDTATAARLFHRLAEACARQRMPLRAAGLLMEAAVAEAAGGEANRAAEDGVRALAFFAQAPLPERVAASAERLVDTLRQGGHEKEAAAVEKALDSGLGSAGTTRQALRERMTAAAQAQRPGRLPARCTTCGGPLLPAEVAWHDPETAECPYCGGVIKAET